MKIAEPLIGITVVLSISCVISYFLLLIQKKLSNTTASNAIVDNINKLLPQTQCGQCSYPGCKPYATAISKLEADINLCPPGGQKTIDNLALLLNIPSKPLAEDLLQKEQQQSQMNLVAKIDEAICIGCLLCIKACPVSAIVGANKLMHTVITDQCTGCELCIAPCPMDCITMVEQTVPVKYWQHKNPV